MEHSLEVEGQRAVTAHMCCKVTGDRQDSRAPVFHRLADIDGALAYNTGQSQEASRFFLFHVILTKRKESRWRGSDC